MTGEFERIKRNGETLWKCVTCGEMVRSQNKGKPRHHRCRIVNENDTPGSAADSVRTFFQGYQQNSPFQASNIGTPVVGAPVVQPPVIPVVETPLTSRPQASPILLQPPPIPQSPAMDMTQLLQFFQMQQD